MPLSDPHDRPPAPGLTARTADRRDPGPPDGAWPVVVAPATPPGRAALAVIRFSGAGVLQTLSEVVRPIRGSLAPGRARRVHLLDGEAVFDDGMAVFGAAPRTYTGEDTLEVTVHGNPLIVERLIQAAVSAGVRVAGPGELTRRAVLNGKLDLLQAEAIDQVIRATSEAGLAVGRQGLDGGITRWVEQMRGELVGATAELEARLDYPADELAFLDDRALVELLGGVARRCREVAETQRGGRLLVEGARVALIGPVNAGKSSLFNALLGRTRAIVHDRPGTTRDVIEARCRLQDLELTLLDTAGERPTDDPVEAAGLALAQELIAEADLLLVVLRASPDAPDPVERAILERTAGRRRLVIYNGVDMGGVAPAPPDALPTSARTGEGLDRLRGALREALTTEAAPGAELMIASARQRDLLLAVAEAVEEAVEALPLAGPAVAADGLVRALEELDALTGADTREEVLDALFARFCIGK